MSAAPDALPPIPQPEAKGSVVLVAAASGAPLRYRILARISDDKLRSIPDQVKDCATYVATLDRGAVVDAIYNLGEQSGFSITESDIYQRMLADARAGAFHGLVVRDTSRLGRDYWEKLGTLRDLRSAKVELHVVEDGGRFDFEDRIAKVKSWASTWADEEKKKEEIRKAVRATDAIRAMGLPTTRAPYGYTTTKDPSLGRRVWRPTKDADTVRALFAAYLIDPDQNLSALGRAHGLAPDRVQRILENRCYTGGFVWKGEFRKCAPEVVPPIVDEATFAAVQAARAARRA